MIVLSAIVGIVLGTVLGCLILFALAYLPLSVNDNKVSNEIRDIALDPSWRLYGGGMINSRGMRMYLGQVTKTVRLDDTSEAVFSSTEQRYLKERLWQVYAKRARGNLTGATDL